MGTLTVKLPESLEAKFNSFVRRHKRTKSALVREAIENLLADEMKPQKGSVYDLIKDLPTVGKGTRDLATNPKHMKGYGK